MLQKVEVNTLVVKISSRCNLNCDYCYIYNGKDDSWRSMPKLMNEETIDVLIKRIEELYEVQETKPSIVFHGGEPLLMDTKKLESFVSKIVKCIPEVLLSIQSNGTIYNKKLEELLVKYKKNLILSISVDGPKKWHDFYRKYINGKGSFDTIQENIQRFQKESLVKNILTVVNTDYDPKELLNFMKITNVPEYNIILRDADYLTPPPSNRYTTGEWLCKLFAEYSSGEFNFDIKFIDDLTMQIYMLKNNINKPNTTYTLCTICIDTNGQIKQSDTFRINGEASDSLGEDVTIHNSSIYSVANGTKNKYYMQIINNMPDDCKNCRYISTCGGGYPSHRYDGISYNNPSIYCKDYLKLYEFIENKLP